MLFGLEVNEHSEEEAILLEEERGLKAMHIAEKVTFENANDFVYSMVHHDREAAAAVYKELQYWDDVWGRL